MPGKDIKSMTRDELAGEIASLGLPLFRAGQIFDWLQVRGVTSFDEMTNLSKDLRASLAQRYELRFCEVVRRLESKDDTVKYLFRLIDGECVESVLMHYKYGYTLCVSTQVGCKMGCAFCASTLGGFVRSLTASEILSQIHAAQRDRGVRVSHVVLMGMGEPLDNFDNVMRFLDLVGDEKGLHIGSFSKNGVIPTNNSYKKHPKDHQSAPLSWPLFNIISGAIYSGVPHTVYVLPSHNFEKPKSTKRKNPLWSIKRFSGRKSLYIIFFECNNSNINTTCPE